MKKKIKVFTAKDINDAMILSGYILPTTPDEVAMLEDQIGINPTLPKHLQNPHDLLEKSGKPREPSSKKQYLRRNEKNLELYARAARDGGIITEDISNSMRQAKEQAKKKNTKK